MIFAAGLGKRLQSYTQSTPKALVEVNAIPMLELLIKHFHREGIRDIIINTHHFSDQIISFIEKNNGFGCNISFSDETQMLLDTGGGLRKASWFFDNNHPFLVHNVDVLSDIDFNLMLNHHNRENAIATLAVSHRKSSRYLLFDKYMRLCGWENASTGEVRQVVKTKENLSRYAFAGVHIISPEIFKLLRLEGKFSIIDAYLELAGSNKIVGFCHNPYKWVDMGKPENISEAEKLLLTLPEYF